VKIQCWWFRPPSVREGDRRRGFLSENEAEPDEFVDVAITDAREYDWMGEGKKVKKVLSVSPSLSRGGPGWGWG